MQRRSRFARLVTGPLAAALAAVLVSAAGLSLSLSACSNQGEGERCDTRGDKQGNDECQDGLTCRPGVFRCCPIDESAPTVAACKVTRDTPSIDAGPAAEAGNDADATSSDASPGDASDASDAPDANATTDALVSDAGDGGG